MNSEMSQPFDPYAPLPQGTVVLEASAGTGKTWTIAALAARLIAETDTSIAELLIITFNRAAASELRSRIRERLDRLGQGLAQLAAGAQLQSSADPLLVFLATGFLAPPGHPPEGRQPPEAGHPSDSEHLPPHGESPALLDAETLRRRALRLARAAGEIDTATITTIHSFLHLGLRGFGVAGDLAADVPLIESVSDLIDEAYRDTYLGTFIDVAEPELKISEAKNLAKGAASNPTAVLYPPHREAEAAGLAIKRDFAQQVRSRVQQRKRDAGVIGFDDLLTMMAEAVDPRAPAAESRTEYAREQLRQRWGHVFVDEFQDTDDTQWRILRSVFDGHCNLTLIGDPKQAIYSFRGGDLHTYLDATQSAGIRRSLDRNYRSDPQLLDGVNELFAGADLGDPRITVPRVRSGVAEPRVRLSPEQDQYRVRLRLLDGGGKDLSADEIRRQVTADVVADIAEVLTGATQIREGAGEAVTWRRAQAGDVAVLCHSNSAARELHQALLGHGINAVLSSGVSVFDSRAASEWATLLTAMDQPSNQRVRAAAALGPFFGYRAHELVTERERVLDELSERLGEYSRLLTDYGVAAVFERALGGSKEGMAARILGQVGGERLLTDLRHISELMHGTHPLAGAHTLIGWLQQQNQDSENSEHPRRLESDDAAVKVLTLHSAKGLEFPFVYLATTASESFIRRGFPAQHLDGQRVLPLEATKEVKDGYTEEQFGERARLLYVGLTRAVGQVTAYWSPAHQVNRKALHRLLANRITGFNSKRPVAELKQLIEAEFGPVVSVELLKERRAPVIAPEPAAAIGEARAWTRTIDRTWRRSSYTSLVRSAEQAATNTPSPEEWEFKEDPAALEHASAEAALPAAVESGEPTLGEADLAPHLPSPMADLPRGAHFGSFIHGVLETVDTRAQDLRGEIATRVSEQLVFWPQSLDQETVVEAIRAVLSTPLLPAVPTTLGEISPSTKLAELDFQIPLDGGIYAAGAERVTLKQVAELLRRHLTAADPLFAYAQTLASPSYSGQSLRGYLTGSIDVVFGWGGKYYVADYKTDWLGSIDEPLTTAAYAPPELNRAMEGSSYPLQALIYTVALHRYLQWRLPGYDPSAHLGGVLYLYVRGMAGPTSPVIDGHTAGVFTWVPPSELICELSVLFDGNGGGENGQP